MTADATSVVETRAVKEMLLAQARWKVLARLGGLLLGALAIVTAFQGALVVLVARRPVQRLHPGESRLVLPLQFGGADARR